MGEWTLQIMDIHPNGRTGVWLTWSMTLWGESGVLKRAGNGTPSPITSASPPAQLTTFVSSATVPASTDAVVVTATPPTVPGLIPSPNGDATTIILNLTSPPAKDKAISEVGTDTTSDDANGFAIFGGFVFLAVLALGAFSAYLIWRRVSKKRAAAATGAQEDPESYESLNGGDEEDATSFAREQRGGAVRSNSPPRMQEVLFETGTLDDDEDF